MSGLFLSGAGVGGPLSSIITALGVGTADLILDAGDAASYNGSDTEWRDTSGNGYDFFRGVNGSAGADDPTSHGSSGALSSSEYWTFDGGDYFTYDTTVEAWMKPLHQNNALFSFICVFYWDGANATNLFSTAPIGDNGLRWSCDATGHMVVRAGKSGSSAMLYTSTATASAGWNFFGVSQDESSSTGLNIRINGSEEVNQNGTYASPTSTDSTSCYIASNGATPVPNTTRMGMFAHWPTAIGAANLQSLYNAVRGRFGF